MLKNKDHFHPVIVKFSWVLITSFVQSRNKRKRALSKCINNYERKEKCEEIVFEPPINLQGPISFIVH